MNTPTEKAEKGSGRSGVVITALNEVESIGIIVYVLSSMLRVPICVIDDGSTDGTGKMAEANGAYVIRHEEPQGIGRSLMEAWKYALDQGWDYTVQMDAGGSHYPSQVEELWRAAQDKDILIGSRFVEGGWYGGRKWRAIASRVCAWLCNFATHQHITDWTSGYRVFSRKALEALLQNNYFANGHAWQMEVLSTAIAKKLTISEAPIYYVAGRSSLKWKTIDEAITVYLWMLNA